jgi:hypothetical protein
LAITLDLAEKKRWQTRVHNYKEKGDKTMLNDSEMYKIQYSSGKGKVELISILQKDGQNWGLLKDSRIEEMLVSKFIKKDHYNVSNDNVGYGQIVVTDRLTYVTGSFEIPKN